MSGPSKESMERAREWIVESGLFQKLDHFKFPSSLATLLDEVRADERESCAEICDAARVVKFAETMGNSDTTTTLARVAEAIRERTR